MIIPGEECPHCGNTTEISHLKCDNCGSLYELEGFPGIVIHFSEDEQDEDEDSESLEESNEIYAGEFHFCQGRCLTEYILAHPSDFFAPYDDRGAIMMVGPNDIAYFFYALGRCDYD